MIVCSCNVLADKKIASAARVLTLEHPGRPVTPGRLFLLLGVRPQCGACSANLRRIVADAGIAFTCPEPLASAAEGAGGMSLVDLDAPFDGQRNVP
ncbi:MAG: hypothetical protein GY798_33260 [Hyphomicrobiales bacterium]|nr:hypothetical protein [Hyphomicrobiales bacterium]